MDGKRYGFYRARVIDNKDPRKFGRVLVWIPTLMHGIELNNSNSLDAGLWARPANNPIGGRNTEGGEDNFYAGSSFIPLKDSWVWVFFEDGNPNRPYYFSALDIENAPVLPENRVGSNYEKKWTLFKSHAGRTVIISDDPDDQRVEITGKKRTLKNPPSGDEDSVYKIDGNQTSILLDERSGKEKLLIRTYKGDFINLDIEKQQLQISMKSDIKIKTDGNLFIDVGKNANILARKSLKVSAKNDFHISSKNLFNISTKGVMNIKADKSLFMSSLNLDIFSDIKLSLTSGAEIDMYSTAMTKITAMAALHLKSIANVAIDGATLFTQMNMSLPAIPGTPATPAITPVIIPPLGNRD